MRPRQKDNQERNNVLFKKNLKIFRMKKKNEGKTNFFSTYHITLIFLIQKRQSQLTSNIRLFFSNLWYLMKCSTSKLAKNGQKRHSRATLRCWGLCFHRKTKITSVQSTSFDILKDVKGCKETSSRPLHINNM